MLDAVADVARRTGVAGIAAGTSTSGARRRVAVGSARGDQPMRIASVTKPIVAAAAVLVGADLRPVIDVLPELRDSWTIAPDLTLRDLLSHTSGLLEESLTKPVLAAMGDGPDALSRAAAAVVSRRQERPPGTVWQYYNGNYYLAGAALARVGGDTFEAVVEREVLRPAGMTSTTFAVPDGAAHGHVDGSPVPPSELPRARRPTAASAGASRATPSSMRTRRPGSASARPSASFPTTTR